MHALNNKCWSDGAGLLLHVLAGRTYQRGKSAAYCLDGVRELGTRSSLLHCFKEECRQEVGDLKVVSRSQTAFLVKAVWLRETNLKEVFPIGSYVCSDCSNIVEEYPKRRGRCQYAERLLSSTATILSQSARSPARGRPLFPLAMSCRHQSC